ncbi:hypothetical protein DFH09DRAFT_1100212 [Mycena vulgaris]|nr:hypothetical protein DFH09DRAFT_1100212 [Mycena vulgaris]
MSPEVQLIPSHWDFIRQTGTVDTISPSFSPSHLSSSSFLVSDLGSKPATFQAVSSLPQAVKVILKLSSSRPQVVPSRFQAVNSLQFPNSESQTCSPWPILLFCASVFLQVPTPILSEAVFASISFLGLFLCSETLFYSVFGYPVIARLGSITGRITRFKLRFGSRSAWPESSRRVTAFWVGGSPPLMVIRPSIQRRHPFLDLIWTGATASEPDVMLCIVSYRGSELE